MMFARPSGLSLFLFLLFLPLFPGRLRRLGNGSSSGSGNFTSRKLIQFVLQRVGSFPLRPAAFCVIVLASIA